MSLDFKVFKICEQCKHNDYESFNITHNLSSMARQIGVYKCLWKPKENNYKTVKEIIPILEDGIQRMVSNRDVLLYFNPPNGWGDYASFLDWLTRVLAYCKTHPDNNIESNR